MKSTSMLLVAAFLATVARQHVAEAQLVGTTYGGSVTVTDKSNDQSESLDGCLTFAEGSGADVAYSFQIPNLLVTDADADEFNFLFLSFWSDDAGPFRAGGIAIPGLLTTFRAENDIATFRGFLFRSSCVVSGE